MIVAIEKLPWVLMMMEIFSRLPAKSLFQFRCVSKTWLQLLTTDPCFSKNNPNHHPGIIFKYQDSKIFYYASDYKAIHEAKVLQLPFPNSWLYDYKIVAICNGLLCLEILPLICIYGIQSSKNTLPSHHVHLISLVVSTNEYKVIRIVSCEKKKKKNSESEGTKSWRFLPYLYRMKYAYEPSVLVNGALHWLVSRTLGLHGIVSFDMKDEFFREIP
ncbi:hypothetical protein AQUCO_03700128v1 [Aquilegia coerulea]|uniref:F-box domain-containing protein n=1 Tax=Aquilegia coerulea TaxID=218851 RepID=A0A2G5CTL8_AQUCA|nr:hypothetical protein AQUCO_03700128v1 [Aquilegia coerulea]